MEAASGWFSVPLAGRSTAYVAAALRSMAGGALILVGAWVEFRLQLTLPASELLQLLAVLGIAMRYGLVQASIASIVAFLCLDFFFASPLFSFRMSNPEDWTALAVFEASALIVCRLSTQARQQAQRAAADENEMERLYNLSRQLLAVTRQDQPLTGLLRSMQGVFSLDAAVLFDAAESSTEQVGDSTADLAQEAQDTYLRDADASTPEKGIFACVIRAGVRPMGALALRGQGLSPATVQALSSIAGIVLEAAKAFARETRAEAERQSEQLRTAVLDALAHEYKTPLTVIRSATSGLMEMGNLGEVQLELVGLVDHEIQYLDSLTTRLLQMSRLDSVDVRLRPECVDVDELVAGLTTSMKQAPERRRVRVKNSGGVARIWADRQLAATALVQFLDNAAKYSTPASDITLSVELADGDVRIGVHNFGPLIRSEERGRIFQRFYRSSDVRYRANGSGLGLSISKKVADLHHAKIWVTSEERSGTTFYLAFNSYKEKQK
jgi:two-component system sensor histidine kinase KdpD